MKCKKIIFVTLIYLVGICTSYGMEMSYDDYAKNAVQEIKLYKNLMISNIRTENEKGAEMYKIIISTKKSLMPEKTISLTPPAPKIVGEPIWEITPELPLTEDQCLVSYADLCDEELNKSYRGSCFKPCIGYGPKFLGYDEKRSLLYFTAASASIGTGGGPYFLFVADINKKQIKFLTDEIGPFSGSLSPGGKYLLLFGYAEIVILNTQTMQKDTLGEDNDWTTDKERLHFLNNINWLSETQFSYRDQIKRGKFASFYSEAKENIYDIPSKKIIKSRVMGKNEFVSAPKDS